MHSGQRTSIYFLLTLSLTETASGRTEGQCESLHRHYSVSPLQPGADNSTLTKYDAPHRVMMEMTILCSKEGGKLF